MVGNGVGTSNYFSFKMFQFSGEDADLYLHCEVKLCPTQSGSCDPVSRAGEKSPVLWRM